VRPLRGASIATLLKRGLTLARLPCASREDRSSERRSRPSQRRRPESNRCCRRFGLIRGSCDLTLRGRRGWKCRGSRFRRAGLVPALLRIAIGSRAVQAAMLPEVRPDVLTRSGRAAESQPGRVGWPDVPRNAHGSGQGGAAVGHDEVPAGWASLLGKLGCRVHWLSAARWNADLTVRLSDLLKVARQRTRRKHGGKAQVVVLAYVCESQQRGVFHPHIVLGYRTPADRRPSTRSAARCLRNAGSTGSARARARSMAASPTGSADQMPRGT
jgi:hypothetical protein